VKNPEEENRKKAQGYDSNPDVKYVIQVCVLYIYPASRITASVIV
jgi:hypothetical protein